MLASGIEPVLTLHHNTHPAWFHESTPWYGELGAERFAAFTRRVVDAIPEVKTWITFNEPMVMLLGGYLDGCLPPGMRDRNVAARALTGLLNAHARAYAIIHRRVPGARVGIAHNMAAFAPLRAWHPLDRLLARLGRRGFNLAILEAFRAGEDRRVDTDIESGDRPLLCDFHIHTRFSDGMLDLAAVVDLFGQAGFDAISITDHVSARSDRDTLYFWNNRERFAPHIDAWEIANRDDVFGAIGLKKYPYVASSDFHRPRQLYSWKTLLSCGRSAGEIKRCLRDNRGVAITLFRNR